MDVGEPEASPSSPCAFSLLGTQLLSKGQSSALLVDAPQMWIHSKVYADGGERGMHCHPVEDHAFFVVGGRARFQDDTGKETEIGPFDGIMVPRGVNYRFEVVGEENLVMLRIGAGELGPDSRHLHHGPDGQPAAHPNPGVAAPGARFDGVRT